MANNPFQLNGGESMDPARTSAPVMSAEDGVTELLLHAFIDLIQERKAAGRKVLAATHVTIATWLSERTGLRILPRHIQILTTVMEQAHLITIGGGGIGRPNTYDLTEDQMGTEQFWNQVDGLLAVWQHPSRASMLADDHYVSPDAQ